VLVVYHTAGAVFSALAIRMHQVGAENKALNPSGIFNKEQGILNEEGRECSMLNIR
jgi:hypothetical protein